MRGPGGTLNRLLRVGVHVDDRKEEATEHEKWPEIFQVSVRPGVKGGVCVSQDEV